ncbi:MAG TPA: hypothetical protein VFS00_26050, partial [Polyangiaceae bacterium]|nr:hypothetical protein [Polyangiaceae bacterium]
MRVLGWIFAVLLVLGFAGGAYWVKSRYDAHLQALAQCQADATEARSTAQSRDGDLARANAEREVTEKIAASARADLSATQAELEGLRSQRVETEQRLAAFRQVTEKLQKMIDTGKLNV